ncbi:AAA family ATPase [Gardnerella piotii]|uniref:Nuclease SbcCD subunit C n=1 Tax=Gardnerella piotii TaxID=2792977 RepID=A0AAU8NQC3_9BIFI
MITDVNIYPHVPFNRDSEMSKLDKMQPVCFIFGSNGSGKTTISQFIKDKTDENSDNITWDESSDTKVYVYNRNFVRKNFLSGTTIPGVFTIGQEAVIAKQEIERLSNEIEKESEKLENRKKNLKDAEEEKQSIEKQIAYKYWEIKTSLPKDLDKQWANVKGKQDFKKLIDENIESLNPDEVSPDIEELAKNAKILFDAKSQPLKLPMTFESSSLLDIENSEIFTKKISGKESNKIGKLIKQLENSDWVSKGKDYLKGDICPFCQQHTITKEFINEFNNFYDESYKKDINELENSANNYRQYSQVLIANIENQIKDYNEYTSKDLDFQIEFSELKRIIGDNISQIEKKINEPSVLINIATSKNVCTKLKKLFENLKIKVSEHNALIDNKKKEKNKVFEERIKYVSITAKHETSTLHKNLQKEQKRIDGLNEAINTIENKIKEYEQKCNIEKEKFMNSNDTAKKINNLLEQFGFSNFKISVSQEDKSYYIVRNDGTPVNDTLSEGEMNFLTFLYFYQLIKGSLNKTDIDSERIVVIDDPISSMDANVLFIVSSLVRELAYEVRKGKYKIKQLIVLTHNITFHREVTYIRANEGNSKTSYYLIKKLNGYSIIEHCSKNPISSTYELLWQNLFCNDCNPMTAQNISRRIIETFFNLVGISDVNEIILRMKSPDREIAQSLMSWANAGSHNALDEGDIVVNTNESTEAYKNVLKKIFTESDYKAHYEEMIKRLSR